MARVKHQRNRGRFAGVPLNVMQHSDYIGLSFSARALLFEFSMQYNGNNNGKLCAIHSQLGLRGFKSGDTITKAVRNLINANLIVLTKIGMFGKGKREPNYYAITWQPIDNIHGFDMDVNPTNKPIRQFSVELRR